MQIMSLFSKKNFFLFNKDTLTHSCTHTYTQVESFSIVSSKRNTLPNKACDTFKSFSFIICIAVEQHSAAERVAGKAEA